MPGASQTCELSDVSEVETCLGDLYRVEGAPERRKAANQSLINLQQSHSAWQVCLELLVSTTCGQSARLFAAQTLRFKIQRHLDSLPVEAIPLLRDRLIDSCNTFLDTLGPLTYQLCLALAALAVQWEAWTDLQSYLVTRLQPPAALLALTALPEESCEEQYRSPQRKQGRHGDASVGGLKVRSCSLGVLSWLSTWLQAESPRVSLDALLHCFTSWVRLGSLHDVELSTTQPLIHTVLLNIFSPDAAVSSSAQVAVEAVIEQCPFDVVPILFGTIHQLAYDAVEAVRQQDLQKAQVCCSIFSSFCQYNMPLWASATPEGYALRTAILQMVLMQEPHYDQEDDEPLAMASLQAWCDLAEYADVEHLLHPTFNGPRYDGELQLITAEEAGQCLSAFVLKLLQSHQQCFMQLGNEEAMDTPFIRTASEALSSACHAIGSAHFLSILQHLVAAAHASSRASWLKVAAFAVYAAESPLLDFMAEAEEAREFATSLAQLFMDALQALGSANADWPLSLQILMPVPQFAVPLIHALSEEDSTLKSQDVLHPLLELAGASLGNARLEVLAGHAIMALCEAAALSTVPLPSGMVTSLVQLADASFSLATEQSLVTAVAHCLSAPTAAVWNTPAGRQQAVHHLLQVLPPALQQLVIASIAGDHAPAAVPHQWRTASEAALRALARLRTLLSHGATYLGQGAAPGSHAGPGGASTGQLALQVMVQAWPLMQAVLALPPSEDIRGEIAKCCTFAMRSDAAAFRAVAPGFVHAAAQCFPAPGACSFAGPLIQALELYGQDASLRPCLLAAVTRIFTMPAVAQLAQFKVGDQFPQLVQGTMVLSTACTRSLWPEEGQAVPWEVLSLLRHSLPLAAACATCNHHDAASSALSCLDALLGRCCAEACSQPEVATFLLQAGLQIVRAVVWALLAPSPLLRVFKATSILTRLAATRLPPDLLQPAGGSMPAALQQWLSAGLDSLPPGLIGECDKAAVVSEWGAAMSSSGDKQQNQGGRVASETSHRLKMAIRSFAERHQQQHYVL